MHLKKAWRQMLAITLPRLNQFSNIFAAKKEHESSKKFV